MKSVHEYEEFSKVAGGGAAEVYALADAVVHRYQRKAAPGDPDDWRQDAALAIVEGVRRRGRTLADRGYHFEAARLTVALAISRALAVVHLSEHAAHRAREFQNRTPIAGCGYARIEGEDISDGVDVAEVAGGPLTGDRAAALEREKAKMALISHLGGRAARLRRPRDRALVTLMLGARGAEPMEPDEAAWAVGIGVRAAHGAAERFASEVADDRRAQRLRRNVRVMEEA